VGFSRTVETYVDIDAPPQRVWDVLVEASAVGQTSATSPV
jgi:uncharacterized protein YndB with AHSA1/START domain